MIHAEKASNTVQNPPTPEELCQKLETAEKINFHILHFLSVRKNLSEIPSEKLLEMTVNLAQMSPEIYTIYNVRRELLCKTFREIPDKSPQRYDLIIKELELVNFLLKKQQKSYSLFTHRQWLILQGFKEEKLLEIHLKWNYRNWLVELSGDKGVSLKENAFTKMKIEQNFTNFSALHFRAGNFRRFYHFFLKNSEENTDKTGENSEEITEKKGKNTENREEIEEIVTFGMPLKVIAEELEFIATGLYMQANEQGIWQYHHWLIELMIPIYIQQIIPLENSYFLLILSQKCRNFSAEQIEITINGDFYNDFIVRKIGNIEFSRFFQIELKENAIKEKKTMKIMVKNGFKLYEKNGINFIDKSLENFNRKRFILSSEFEFFYEEKISQFLLISVRFCSEKDLKFREFVIKMIEKSEKIVKEILELENNNKFVIIEKNFLIEAKFPGNSQENLEKPINSLKKLIILPENTREILRNLAILRENYEKQRYMFEKFIDFYKAKLDVEERIEKGDWKGYDVINIMNLERFEEIIVLLVIFEIFSLNEIKSRNLI